MSLLQLCGFMHCIYAEPNSEPLVHREVIESEENINLRAAFIHVLGDLIQSVGVMVAGVIIWAKPEWSLADPISTIIFTVLGFATTFKLVSQAVHVLMEGTPEGISPELIERDLLRVAGVLALHDLHIWSVSLGKVAVSGHIRVVRDCHGDAVLNNAQVLLAEKYQILHTTLQLEVAPFPSCQHHFHASVDNHPQEA
jgi:zinc transporter 2